jgi:UDP-N-acetylmuramate-alanine ligase
MPHPSAHFIASLEDTCEYLLKHLRKNDVLLVLSAGDADQVSANVLTALER